MATRRFWIVIAPAAAPLYGSVLSDTTSTPAANTTAYGWQVAKTATSTPYFRGRIGAATFATVAQAASFIDAQTGPQKGTSTTNTTTADCFRSATALTGTFAAGNWTLAFGMRTSVIQHSGRIRCIVWASTAADGTGARKLSSATIVGSTITASALSTTYTSTGTWAAPTVTLANEYLFFSVEWQVTTAGTSNTTNIFFRQSEAYIDTTDWVPVPATEDGWNYLDKLAVTVLSNADKTATVASAAQSAARSTQGYFPDSDTGKYYVEFVSVVGVSNISNTVGFSPTTSSLSSTTNVIAVLHSDGLVYNNNVSIGPTDLFVGGDVVCMAWDMQAKRVWVRINGGLWNSSATANPATNTGGYDVTTLGAPSAKHCLWAYTSYTGNGATIRTELADLGYTIPSGFMSWMGETSGPVDCLGTLAETEDPDVVDLDGLVGLIGTLADSEDPDDASFDGEVITDAPATGILDAIDGGAYELLLHMDGADASTVFPDSGGWAQTVTAHGAAQVDTQSVFAGQSLQVDGPNDYLSLDTGDYAFGVGDFCVDMRVRVSSPSEYVILYEGGSTGFKLSYDSALLFESAAGTITGSAFSANTNYHVAVTRAAGMTRLWRDGVQQGATLVDATNYGVTAGYPRVGGANTRGVLAAIEVMDVPVFTGAVHWLGVLAATDTSDTVAFAGIVGRSGTLAVTDAADTAVFAGAVTWFGILGATEAADVSAITGKVSAVGTLAVTEATDVVALTGKVEWFGTLAATEITTDIAAFAGLVVKPTADSTLYTADNTILTADSD